MDGRSGRMTNRHLREFRWYSNSFLWINCWLAVSPRESHWCLSDLWRDGSYFKGSDSSRFASKSALVWSCLWNEKSPDWHYFLRLILKLKSEWMNHIVSLSDVDNSYSSREQDCVYDGETSHRSTLHHLILPWKCCRYRTGIPYLPSLLSQWFLVVDTSRRVVIQYEYCRHRGKTDVLWVRERERKKEGERWTVVSCEGRTRTWD